MIGPLKNHPIVLLKTTVMSLLVLLILSASLPEPSMVAVFAAVIVVFIGMSVRIWSKTAYTFDDTGITITKRTAFREDRNIPYSKVSAVNVVRRITDRIFGTTSVMININSSVNSARPEVVLVLKNDLAEQVRSLLDSKLYGVCTDVPSEFEETEEQQISKIQFNDFEVILHSLLNNPTASHFAAIVSLAYSIFDLTRNAGTAMGILALVIFFVNLVMPAARQVLLYFDFTAYRSGDKIYIEHGLLQKYHSSFDVSRINAVRIRRPLIARLLGMSSIQAEVVGINAVSNDVTPILCLLTNSEKHRMIMEQLIPEFIYDADMIKQPKSATVPVFIKSAVYSLICIISAIVITIVMFVSDIDSFTVYIVTALSWISAMALTIIFVVCGFKSLQNKGIVFGKDMFTMVDGIIDRMTTILYYDRVQSVSSVSGPLARNFGLSVCRVTFLSSQKGMGTASVGYLSDDVVFRVGDIMMQRLRDGTYDYRMNEI